MKINNTVKLVLAIAVSELAGIIGSVFTLPSISGWYATLAKPELAPPNWVFGPGLDDAVCSYGYCGVPCLKDGFGAQRCKDCSVHISRSAGAQHALVNYLFWSAQPGRRAY